MSSNSSQLEDKNNVGCYHTSDKKYLFDSEGTVSTGMTVKRIVEHEVYIPDLGLKIQLARKAINKPLTVLCKEADVSRNYWYQLESGKIPGTVSEQTLRRIEKVLGVNLGVDFDEILSA